MEIKKTIIRDNDEIIMYDSSDDKFDDITECCDINIEAELTKESLQNRSVSNASNNSNMVEYEIWDDIDGEWFKVWLPKDWVTKTDDQIEHEANDIRVTIGIITGIFVIIGLSICFSCWMYL